MSPTTSSAVSTSHLMPGLVLGGEVAYFNNDIDDEDLVSVRRRWLRVRRHASPRLLSQVKAEELGEAAGQWPAAFFFPSER